MIRIYFSNHDEEPGETFIGLPFDVCFVQPMAKIRDSYVSWERDDIFQATHAVMHYTFDSPDPDRPAELDALKRDWQELPDCKRNSLILLLVSAGGESDVRRRPHELVKRGHTNLYVLGARNQACLSMPEVVEAFYRMSETQAQAVCDGRLSDCPTLIRSLFQPPSAAPELLPALSILCQGFLAVQCGVNGDGGINVEVPDPGGKIAAALGHMKWAEVMQASEVKSLLDPRLTKGSQSDRDEMRTQALSARFWNVFAGTDRTKLSEAVCKEWKRIPGSKKFEDSVTKDLIRLLPLQEDSAGAGFATKAAESYIELVAKLGGA